MPQYSATESATYDPLGNCLTRASVEHWAKPYSGTASPGAGAAISRVLGTRAMRRCVTSRP